MNVWEDGLHSLTYLERFIMQTRHSLREDPSSEDTFVRTWLLNSPPLLGEVVIWTKAFRIGERLVKWHSKAQGVGWRKEYEQNSQISISEFI